MCFTKEPELERIKDSEIRFLRYEGQTEIKIYVSLISLFVTIKIPSLMLSDFV